MTNWRTVTRSSVDLNGNVVPLTRMLVILSLEPDLIVAIADGFVFWRIAGASACRQTRHLIVVRRIEEKRDGVAFAAGAVDHTMRRRDEAAIRPAPEQLAGIHQEGIVDHRRVDPLTGSRAEREAGHLVRRQQRHERAVAVRSQAEFVFLGSRRLRRVVREAKREGRFSKSMGKPVRREVEGYGIDRQYRQGQALQRSAIGEARLAKARQGIGPLVASSE